MSYVARSCAKKKFTVNQTKILCESFLRSDSVIKFSGRESYFQLILFSDSSCFWILVSLKTQFGDLGIPIWESRSNTEKKIDFTQIYIEPQSRAIPVLNYQAEAWRRLSRVRHLNNVLVSIILKFPKHPFWNIFVFTT